MLKANEIKGKVKETANKAKDWAFDHKEGLIASGALAGVLIGSIVLGRKYNKKFEKAWRAAKQAYERGQVDYDFGPYKVMRFLEPKTGEFIGETVCHEDACKAFLDLK